MSSDDFAIRLTSVSKRFELYDHPKDRLKQFVLPRYRRLAGLPERQYFREFWALHNVSLEVRKGGACGIVGLNGSGKSTLLQIITGTLTPTAGSVQLNGRIAALLELGSGFDPNFSGEENVLMYGSLLGFSTKQTLEKLPAIRAFAEIGDHFSRPLHTYSSGMQMRLAFAVFTAFDPDILIVDEALAVGDAYFQQKCFYVLEQFRARGGTLLFVSHDANAVKTLCDHALLLDAGKKVADGEPKRVIDLYQGLVMKRSDIGTSATKISQSDITHAGPDGAECENRIRATTTTGNGDADLLKFALLDSDMKEVSVVESESRLIAKYTIQLNKYFERPAFGIIVRNRLGQSIYETTTFAQLGDLDPLQQGTNVTVHFAFDFNVRIGQYSFSVGVSNKGYARSEFEEYSLLMHDVAQIDVMECEAAKFYGGVYNMRPIVSVEVEK